MSVESRDIIQTGEILQDSMPATSTLNSGGENLTYANSPFTLAKLYRWLVGISKAIFGEKTRRNGAKRIQGLEQTLTGTITSSGTAVTGSGTLFLTELYVGAFIAGTANEYREVLSISGDTSLTLVSAFSVDIASAQNMTRLQALAERVDGVEEYVNECFNGDLNDWSASSFSSPASNSETANNWFVNYDGTIGTFAVSREAFTVGQTDVPGEPQYYLRWNHTSAGSAQTIKSIRHKISGVRSFAGQTIQVTFYAKFASAAAVTVGATQHFGSGGGPSSDVSVTAKSRTLTTTFARYTVTLAIPSISGKTIGTSGDALYINFNLPLNATCDFQLANVSAYKGTAEIPFKLAVYTQRLKATLKTYFDTLYAPAIKYAKISETQTSGTNGGTATADGTFKTRVLNTEDNDSGAIVSISSNQFTLQAGTYQIHATAPAFAVAGHKAKLRNITDGSDTIIGSTEWNSAVTQVVVTRSSVVGEFTIAGAKAFELQHRFETTKTTNGLGVASSLGTEVYSVVELWKVA